MNVNRAYRIMIIKRILTIIIMVSMIIGFIIYDFINKREKDKYKAMLNNHSQVSPLHSMHGKDYKVLYIKD